MNVKKLENKLLRLRRLLQKPYDEAKEAGDNQEMKRLMDIAAELDEVRVGLALHNLGDLASNLASIRQRIDGHRRQLGNLTSSQVAAKEKVEELLTLTGEETERLAERSIPSIPVSDLGAPVVASNPPPTTSGQLVLTEAHLIALWRRSQFPIDSTQITVFGLRGCRPMEFSGTAMANSHEIVMAPVDYQAMNCTFGHWKPGEGLSLFPGSTVPYGPIVFSKIAADGIGVNQLGRGRYGRYTAGWHKRREGPAGHWALQQACSITIQRTADDADFDLADRWEVGRIAGDNIHCAFHMGVDGNPADAKFSSAGCQVIAGTVRKGQPGTEVGPYKDFIAPFANALDCQKETQYVLFDAEEAQMMIRTQCADKSIILRFGSYGPLVEELQKALNVHDDAQLYVDGAFGPSTFQAVIDFQTRIFGPEADDGIVGKGTAAELGMTLPTFNFNYAVYGP